MALIRSASGGIVLTSSGGFSNAAINAAPSEFTIKPDYSYTTTDFVLPDDNIIVSWRDFTTPANAGPDATTDIQVAGTDGVWVVETSNIAGVDDFATSSTAFNSLTDIIELVWAQATTMAIKFETAIEDYVIKDQLSPAIGGSKHCVLWAPTKTGNEPFFYITRRLTTDTGEGDECMGTSNYTSAGPHIETRNINFSRSPIHITAGAPVQGGVIIGSRSIIRMWSGKSGTFTVDNSKHSGCAFNGIQGDRNEDIINGDLAQQYVNLHDVEMWNASQGGDHNVYVHDVNIYMERVKSSDSSAHLMKVDGPSAWAVDCTFIDIDPDLASESDVGPGDAALFNNQALLGDWRLDRCLFDRVSDDSRRNAISLVPRRGMFGIYPARKNFPFPFDVDNGAWPGYTDSAGIEWNTGAQPPEQVHGRINGDSTGTTLTYQDGRNGFPFANVGGGSPPDNTGSSFYRVLFPITNDTTDVVSNHESTATSDDAGTFTLDTTIPAGSTALDDGIISYREDGVDALSSPLLNEAFYRKFQADGSTPNPDYIWPDLDDGTGKLDLTRSDIYGYGIIDDCMSATRSATFAPHMVINSNSSLRCIAVTGNETGSLPYPPCDPPQGETASWKDLSGAAKFDMKPGGAGAFGSQAATGFDGVYGSDYITPSATFMRNFAVHDAGTPANTGVTLPSAYTSEGKPSANGENIDQPSIHYINAAGAAVALTGTGAQADALTRIETTLASGASVSDSDVVVDDETGIVAGMRAILLVDGDFGSSSERLFACDVKGTYSSGTTIPLVDNNGDDVSLPKAASSGARCCFMTKAGDLPAYLPATGVDL